jgi:hypothetical protein
MRGRQRENPLFQSGAYPAGETGRTLAMKTDSEEQEFLEAARKTLDCGTDNLEASICNRLTRARNVALDQGRSRSSSRWWWMAAPVTAGLVIVVMTASFYFRGERAGELGPAAEVADLEIVTALESPEFYANLDFYQWLAVGDGHADG